MEKEFFDLLGLGVPFYLGAATYAVFSWLDSNASDEATQVISSWLHGRSRNKPDLGNLIISAFDRIYTSPLLTFRAFGRSAVISTIIWFFAFFLPWLAEFIRNWNPSQFPAEIEMNYTRILAFEQGFVLSTFIVADYVSVLFVRQFLEMARRHPIRASVISSILGTSIVAISFLVIMVMSLVSMDSVDPSIKMLLSDTLINLVINMIQTLLPRLPFVMRPAFIIHLWLPLFALSSLVVRLIYLIFRAVEWAQWFLKEGDAHPFKAIGIVATIIVFGSAMLIKEAWTVL